ncbi:MAG: PD-(D/E)XK nuclease-like domain-containing protein [Colwellia sp.]|nr:PD-(D/E)XK nuclease-like domain-containing protein [Colwellia sp.]
MQSGIYENLANDEYHATDALSRSDIMKFRKSAHHFNMRHTTPFKETDAMALGSLVHTLVLEPHLVEQEYYFGEKYDRRTKAGKLSHAQQLESAIGKTFVLPEQREEAEIMAAAINSDSIAASLFDGCKMEESIFWTDSATGLKLKSRPDARKIVNDKESIIVDLKTTKDASPRKFAWSCIDFGYYWQAATLKLALESIGQEMKEFIIVCVENSAPYATAIYVMEHDAINQAVSDLRRWYKAIAECQKTDVWPGYGVQTLGMPKYMIEED